jgi:hypothetical protein
MTRLDTRVDAPVVVRSIAAREMAIFLGTTFSLLALSTTIGLAAALYHVVGPLTVDTEHSGYFAGEVGLVWTAVLVALVVVWWRFAPLRRTPDGRTVAGS